MTLDRYWNTGCGRRGYYVSDYSHTRPEYSSLPGHSGLSPQKPRDEGFSPRGCVPVRGQGLSRWMRSEWSGGEHKPFAGPHIRPLSRSPSAVRAGPTSPLLCLRLGPLPPLATSWSTRSTSSLACPVAGMRPHSATWGLSHPKDFVGMLLLSRNEERIYE